MIPTWETVCENRGCAVAAAGRGLYTPPGAPSGERSDCGQIIPRTSSGVGFCSLRLAESYALADTKAGCPISRIHLSRPPCAGRYNSLDLASKVVRQRRATPSLGTLPDADSIMFIAGEHGLCRHLFSCKYCDTCMKTAQIVFPFDRGKSICFKDDGEERKYDTIILSLYDGGCHLNSEKISGIILIGRL